MRRRELYRKLPTALSDQFPEIAEARPELLAQHYVAAGLSSDAIPQWQKSWQRAVERSAHVEAISHLTKGRELLNDLPNSHYRARVELGLQTTLGHALAATRGWSDPLVGKSYARSLELSRYVGDSAQLSRRYTARGPLLPRFRSWKNR